MSIPGLAMACLATAALACVCSPAPATAQVLSGSYALNFTSICPASVSVLQDQVTNDVQYLPVVSAGAASSVIGVATFDPTSKTVVVTGQSMGTGGLLQLQGGTGGNTLQPFSSALSVTQGYTNNSTSILLAFLGGTNPQYQAFYTKKPNGTVLSAAFGNLAIAGAAETACVQSGTLTAK